ncbi:MAG: hypothetical protein CBD88_06495 [Flavobacteriales bacterium TMED228]|nr:MAG: hypothetical protein CBD88_06495 [Flavobacteriales bacterium TMED228]
MIYKFKVWVWSPLKAEIHLSAKDDDEAAKIFQALDLSNFQWEREPMLHNRTTYEVTKTDEATKNSTIVSDRTKIT